MHHRVPGGEARRDLVGNEVQRKIERRDAEDHAVGKTAHHAEMPSARLAGFHIEAMPVIGERGGKLKGQPRTVHFRLRKSHGLVGHGRFPIYWRGHANLGKLFARPRVVDRPRGLRLRPAAIEIEGFYQIRSSSRFSTKVGNPSCEKLAINSLGSSASGIITPRSEIFPVAKSRAVIAGGMPELPKQRPFRFGIARVELPHLGVEQIVEEQGQSLPIRESVIRRFRRLAQIGVCWFFICAHLRHLWTETTPPLGLLASHNRPADGLGVSKDAGLDGFVFSGFGHWNQASVSTSLMIASNKLRFR